MKSIKVSDETHKVLNKLGERGETFDQIIRRLLKKWLEAEKK